MMTLAHDLLLPDGKRLHTLISGQAGSGKTYLTEKVLKSAINDPAFGPEHRFILIDPKHEAFKGIKTVKSMAPSWVERIITRLRSGELRLEGLTPTFKWNSAKFRRSRAILIYPDVEELDFVLHTIINDLFKQSEAPKSKFSATLILDESTMVIGPHSIHPAVKRLATQGRSRMIRGVFISQRPISNRWLDGQVSEFVTFDPGMPQDADLLKRRWGINLDQFGPALSAKRYSWLRVQWPGPTYSVMEPIT